MADERSVIEAIEAALAADETNVVVRCHLAELLADAGRHAEALQHAATVLQQEPDHPGALRITARSVSALGGAEPQQLQSGVPDTADELLDRWDGSDALTEVELGELTVPGVRLSDIGGMEDVKRRLELSFMAPLRNPELRIQFGKSLRGGLLLWGPPGCGKTFVARALAGELGARFYNVGLNDVLNMWIGSSERNSTASSRWRGATSPACCSSTSWTPSATSGPRWVPGVRPCGA